MFPESFLDDMRALLGSEYDLFRESLDSKPLAALRINSLRSGALAASERFLEGCVPWENSGFYVKDGMQPGKSPEHAAGAFYLQDASAMAPVSVLNPQPGETVLDLCAAPGGKASQIAGRLAGKGVLVANEYVKSRALILKSNLERMGVTNACVTSAPSGAFKELGETFDAILVDAPCSGEGMFRRDPGAVAEWTKEVPAQCAQRQAFILDNAAACLKSGGRLVYSTCTFNETENEGTVRAFLIRHPEFEPADFALTGVGESVNGCLRLWPHRVRGEGHFICHMLKKGKKQNTACFKTKPDRRAAELASQLLDLCLRALPDGEIVLNGSELILQALPPVFLRGICTLSCGLTLGVIKGKTLEPAHALAMAGGEIGFLRSIELSAVQAARYLQGETLETGSGRGWMQICYQGLPLGWGKSDGSVLKNHLPKGLRLRGGHALEV